MRWATAAALLSQLQVDHFRLPLANVSDLEPPPLLEKASILAIFPS